MSASAPQNAHFCMRCDYIVDGLENDRCPECGSAIVLDDRRTCYTGWRLSVVGRMLLRPPGWVMIGAAVLAGLVGLEGKSIPSIFMFDGTALCGFLLAIGVWVIWLSRLALRAYVGWPRRIPFFLGWRAAGRWLLVPVLMLGFELVPARTAFWLRLFISWPSMERFAHEVLALSPGQAVPQPRWIGLIPAVGAETRDGGVRFLIPESGWCCPVEIAYSPGCPPKNGLHEFTHVFGDWYATELTLGD